MPIASFGSKEFSVSLNKIYPFGDFALSGSINKESQEREGQKPATYIKGLGLESLSISIPLIAQKSVDIRKELGAWQAMRDARVPYYFVLAGKPVIPNKLLLESVEMSDPLIDVQGNMQRANIQLKFEEFAQSASAAAVKSTKKRNNPSYAKATITGAQLSNAADDLF
jgi:phage protein U